MSVARIPRSRPRRPTRPLSYRYRQPSKRKRWPIRRNLRKPNRHQQTELDHFRRHIMASFIRTYTDSSSEFRTAEPRVRLGGSRRGSPTTTRYEHDQHYGSADYRGSHMPLDTVPHWEWRNPLNILTGLILLLLVVALV